MEDFITLSCPTCGAKLEITKDLERFACSHCGQEHIIRRGGGIVSLAPVIGAIGKIQSGVDRTAAELALVRLPREIAELQGGRDRFSAANPEPALNAWPWFCMILGGAIFLVSMVVLLASGKVAIGWPLFSFIALAYGAVKIFYLYPMDKKVWESTVALKLRSLDAQIEKKQTQIKHNQDLLSQ